MATNKKNSSAFYNWIFLCKINIKIYYFKHLKVIFVKTNLIFHQQQISVVYHRVYVYPLWSISSVFNPQFHRSKLVYLCGLFQGQTGMILTILYFVTNFIPFTISPLWKSAKSSALVTTFLQVAKIESRIVIYDIRIFSTKINMYDVMSSCRHLRDLW